MNSSRKQKKEKKIEEIKYIIERRKQQKALKQISHSREKKREFVMFALIFDVGCDEHRLSISIT